MRVCPTCARRYEDAIDFCHDDGQKLVELADGHAPPQPTKPDAATNDLYPPQQDPLPPGSTVGEYVVEKQIGAGGMGVIFSAVHPVIGKKVAIKLLHPAMAHNPDVVARFITEAKAVNQIGHRNIVDIFAFGALPDGRHYFVMEFLEGESLAARLERAPMTADQAFPIWVQAASAIEAAHSRGIIHRDLKPDNIFLLPSPDGPFVKVLDFGIAKLLGNTPGGVSMTSTGAPMGTPLYMSPEQATGAKSIDHRTDLYAFGIILYETISGHPPFRGTTFIEVLSAQIAQEHQPLSEQMEIDPSLERIVDQLMHKDPDGRPPDMGAARTRLVDLRDRMLRGEKMWGTPLAVPSKESNTSKRPSNTAAVHKATPEKSRAPLVAVGVVAALALAGGGVILLKPAPPPPVVMKAEPVAPAPVVVAAAPKATTGRVVVSTNATKTEVFIDKKLPDGTLELAKSPAAAGGMMVKVQIPADEDLVLRVEAEGFKSSSQPLKLGAGEETALPVVLTALAAPPGPPSKGGGTKHAASKPDGKPASAPSSDTNANLMNPF